MFLKDIKCEGEYIYTNTQIRKKRGFFSIATSIAELSTMPEEIYSRGLYYLKILFH